MVQVVLSVSSFLTSSCPPGSTSAGGCSWSVGGRETSGCVALATTQCLSRACIWTGRRDELREMEFIRSTLERTSRSLTCLSHVPPVSYLSLTYLTCLSGV